MYQIYTVDSSGHHLVALVSVQKLGQIHMEVNLVFALATSKLRKFEVTTNQSLETLLT